MNTERHIFVETNCDNMFKEVNIIEYGLHVSDDKAK